MLSRLEIDHLVKIAWNCGIVCGTHSKRQLTRAIQDNFRRPEFLRHILQRWNEQERATLAYLLLAPEASEEERPHRGFPFWNEDGLEDQNYYCQLRQNCETIRAHGFLLPIDGRYSDESDWTIPEDLRPPLEEMVLRKNALPKRAPEGEPEEILSGGQSFLEDLFTLLVVACKERIRLTQEGELFKRTRDILGAFFLGPEEKVFEELPAQYPGRLELMLGYLVRAQILTETDRELRPTGNLNGWMLKADIEKLADCFQHMKRVAIPRDPGCRRAMQYLEGQSGDAGTWRLLSAVMDAIYGVFPGQAWWMKEVRARIYWLFHTLMNLGMLELGRWKATGEIGYRWLPLGRYFIRGEGSAPVASGKIQLTIQPDFEVFAPRDIPLNLRWQLEQVADLVSRDVVYRYRMTRESVYRGLKWGVTLKEILDFLGRHAPRGLPQNVIHDLGTWSEHYGDIAFADVMLLRCRSEQVAREVKVLPELVPLIRGEVSPTDLIIARKHYERIVGLLERNGYMPKPGITTYEEEDS
jgi:hypothetical protein